MCLLVRNILEGHYSFDLHFKSQLERHTQPFCLRGRRLIDKGALCNHPGAELGTDKKKNPVNLSGVFACVGTKRMLTHRNN